MKNAILVPGMPDKDEYYDPKYPTNSNNHWFPWLSKQLQIRDIFAVVIEVPTPWRPRYNIWKKEFERFEITQETILIGHSCGGGFLLRWLSENKERKVGKVILVAPWLNPQNNDPEVDTADFFEFECDPYLVGRTGGVTIFNSDDDYEDIQISVDIIRSNVKDIKYKEFHELGHFTLSDLGTEQFPELLEEILNI